MSKFSKTESLTQTILRSRLTQLALLVLIGLLSVQVFEQYQSAIATAERRQHAATEFQAREAERAQLAEQVRSLQDEYHIEAEIRRHFDVAREGEEVVIILEPPPAEEVAPETPSVTRIPWYQFWR